MTSSRKTDSDKAAKYAIAASKGFSYYLPKSAHRHLQELLKHLPSAARSIYDEYYRDLMCAKACAPESAAAMTKFVTSSFPKIAKKHNAFAREMNEEIDINEHEGYEPVKFPIVAEPDIDEEEAATVADTGKKRKRAPAGFTSFPNHGATPQKKAKAKPEIIPAAVSGSPATPPSSSPGRTLRSPVQANSDDQAAEVGTATPSLTEDVRHLTPESVRYADDYRNSRYSSPLSDVPSSAQLSDEDKPFEEPATRPNADDQDLLQRQHNVSADLIDGHDQEDNLSPLPFQALLRSMDDDLPTAPGGFDAETEMAIDHEALRQSSPVPVISPVTSPLENPVEATSTDASTLEKDTEKISEDVILSGSFTGSDYVLMSEEERWEDSVQALEDFDWNRKGSQWPDGPGLVSIHHEEVGQSAAIFKGNYWDDAGAEVLLPGTDHNLAVSDDESPADVV
ncbi:hypothetical protein E8E11_000456 [Didymella keratinophila]|nr:hypothetical protein E8E11_000456 [Didymella keratinophila]